MVAACGHDHTLARERVLRFGSDFLLQRRTEALMCSEGSFIAQCGVNCGFEKRPMLGVLIMPETDESILGLAADGRHVVKFGGRTGSNCRDRSSRGSVAAAARPRGRCRHEGLDAFDGVINRAARRGARRNGSQRRAPDIGEFITAGGEEKKAGA